MYRIYKQEMKPLVLLLISIAAANYGFSIASFLGTDCSQVTAAYISLHGTQEEKVIYAQLRQSYQENGRLSFEDLKFVYAPTCKTGSHETDQFKEIQCFSSEHLWAGEVTKYFCWCADPTTGHPISGNVTEGTEPMTECGKSSSCWTFLHAAASLKYELN